MSTGEPVDFFEEFIEGRTPARSSGPATAEEPVGADASEAEPAPAPATRPTRPTARPPGSTPASGRTPVAPPPDAPAGGRIGAWLAALAIVAVCAIALALIWWSSRPPGERSAGNLSSELASAEVTSTPSSAPSGTEGGDPSSTVPAGPTTTAAPAASSTSSTGTAAGDPAQVEIALDGGGVVLEGVVGTEELRESFVLALSQLLGDGGDVRDRIEVRPGAGTQVDISLRLEDRILFDLGSADISDEFAALLDRVAITADLAPSATIRVSGHTDISGNDEINDVLSQARADAVVDYLVAQGVARDRLEAVGHGSSQPIADNSTAEGRRANRRIDIEFAM